MNALQQLFTLITDEIPKFLSSMMMYFLSFFVKPYQITRITKQQLHLKNLSSITLVIFSFTSFAIVLGIPSTRDAVLAFDGGLTRSLQKIWLLDTKGKEFYYLFIFALLTTTMTIFLSQLSKLTLPKIIRRRPEYFDLFNIFVSFSVGWFMVISIAFNVAIQQPILATWHGRLNGVQQELASLLKYYHIPDISQILIQPALLVVLVLSFRSSAIIFGKWVGRKSLIKIISEGKAGAIASGIAQRRVYLIPGLFYVLLLASSAMLLQFMARSLFEQSDGDKKIVIKAECDLSQSKEQKLFISSVLENRTTAPFPIKELYVRLRTNKTDRTRSDVGLRIGRGNLVSVSEEGAFLEPGERRYYRLYVTPKRPLPNDFNMVFCESQNDGDGTFIPDGAASYQIEFMTVERVGGDSFSIKGQGAPQ